MNSAATMDNNSILSQPNKDDNNICCLAADCLDKNKVNQNQHSVILSARKKLRNFLKTEIGRYQCEQFIKKEHELGPLLIALVGGDAIPNRLKEPGIDSFVDQLHLTQEYGVSMKSFLNGQSEISFQAHVETNSGMIRKQWFEDTTNNSKAGKKSKKKFGEGRLELYESKMMELSLCLLAHTNNDTTIVSKLFDFSRKSCTTKKKLLRDKFVSTASKYYDESSTNAGTNNTRLHSSRTPSRDPFSPSLQERNVKKKRTTATPIKGLLRKFLSSPTKTKNKKQTENQTTSPRTTSPTNKIVVGETNDNNNNHNNNEIEAIPFSLDCFDDHIMKNNSSSELNNLRVDTTRTSEVLGGTSQDDISTPLRIITPENDDDTNAGIQQVNRIRGGGEEGVYNTPAGKTNPLRAYIDEEEKANNNEIEWDMTPNFPSPSSTSSTPTRSPTSTPLSKFTSQFFGGDRSNSPSNSRSPTTPSERERKRNRFAGLLRDRASEYPTLLDGCTKFSDIDKAAREVHAYLGYDDLISDALLKRKRQPELNINGDKYIRMPKTNTKKSFKERNKDTKWIDRMINVLSSSDGLSADEIKVLIAKELLKEPHVLQQFGDELNIPSITGKLPLDPIAAAAMFQDSNITKLALRKINQYSKSATGCRFTPPETELNALTDHYVEPIHDVATIGEEEITYWFRHIDECLTTMMDNELQELVEKFDSIDVIFGGDHGQRVFSAGIKLILWKGKEKVYQGDLKIGHIDCEKDTYQILKSTLATPINDDLKKINSQYIRVPKQQVTNNNDDDEASSRSCFVEDKDNNDVDNNYFKIKVVGCGDLKFISTCLGRVNREGYWCYLCELGASEFCCIGHAEGEKWTLASMNDRLRKLYTTYELDASNCQHVKGCTDEPLFDALESWDWIIPILHIMMGILNDALTLLLLYVEERHELICDKERTSRKEYWLSLNELEDCNEEIIILTQALKSFETEIKGLKKAKQQRVGTGATQRDRRAFVYDHAQKKDLQHDIDLKVEEYNNKKESIKQKKKDSKYLAAVVKEKKKLIEVIQNENGRTVKTSKLRQAIEQCLKRNGINRGNSHGGLLEGVSCLVFEKNIEVIVSEIRDILLTGSENANEKEINDVMSSFRIHFLLASHTIALIRTERHDMNDGVISQLREVIPLLYQSTERLSLSMKTPKRHILSHAIDMIIKHGSIAEYMEDWVEQLHQKYKKSIARGKLRDKRLRAAYQIRADSLALFPAIRRKKKEIADSVRRNFRGESQYFSSQQADLKKAERRQRRLNAVEEATALFQDSPELLSTTVLNCLDARKEEREAEAATAETEIAAALAAAASAMAEMTINDEN